MTDPRNFVSQVPLPIPSHRGIPIQARSDVIYNAKVPTREEVRKQNYRRRSEQLSHKGFWSFNFRPYEAIGDPIYLDDKRLILCSLGQPYEVCACFLKTRYLA